MYISRKHVCHGNYSDNAQDPPPLMQILPGANARIRASTLSNRANARRVIRSPRDTRTALISKFVEEPGIIAATRANPRLPYRLTERASIQRKLAGGRGQLRKRMSDNFF